ncbi:acetolactate decarboxylase [Flavobacterium tructae]|uniref:acetolactate decarboxylase n=1 Tax=Flavobacterium tructae TaxID=1114873 RepID=UPI002551EE6E|nr:acetolactate decarboxylase [Flavobacterium tructae]MDL2144335.1 acetolactate decarboxylase [Flavobacterium tructae]
MRNNSTGMAVFFIAVLGFLPVKAQVQEERPVFHYSVMDAMRNGVYTGELSIGELAKKGNFGIGTYNYLDGEMIVLDGIFYRVDASGVIGVATNSLKIPFGSVVFFKADMQFELTDTKDIEELQNEVIKRLPSVNKPYAVRIECEFENITVGGARRLDENETTGLAELMKTRPLYTRKHISGTMVGFYNPPYFSAIDLSPFHFHFISRDRKYGGHLISGKLKTATIKVSIDEKPGYEVILPQQNKVFNKPWTKQDGVKSSY